MRTASLATPRPSPASYGPTMSRRWIGVLAIAVAAIMLAPIVVVLLARPVEAPTTSSPPRTSPDVVATATPSVESDLESGVWWRVGWRPLVLGPEVPDFEELTTGRMSGEELGTVRLGGSPSETPGAGGPFVIGPKRGLILYAKHIGGTSELHLVDVVAGDDRTLATTTSVLHHADLAVRSGVAVFITGPRNPGVWRVALDGTGEVELVADLPELTGGADAVLATAPIDALPKQVTLRLDPNEERLAVLTCAGACVLRVVDIATGESTIVDDLDPAFREVTDFVDGVVVVAGGLGYDASTGLPVAVPDGARRAAQPTVGWEVPPGWVVEERQIDPNAQVVGPTWYVAVGSNGEAIPIEIMGRGVGQG